jgi:hypothetical protein
VNVCVDQPGQHKASDGINDLGSGLVARGGRAVNRRNTAIVNEKVGDFNATRQDEPSIYDHDVMSRQP